MHNSHSSDLFLGYKFKLVCEGLEDTSSLKSATVINSDPSVLIRISIGKQNIASHYGVFTAFVAPQMTWKCWLTQEKTLLTQFKSDSFNYTCHANPIDLSLDYTFDIIPENVNFSLIAHDFYLMLYTKSVQYIILDCSVGVDDRQCVFLRESEGERLGSLSNSHFFIYPKCAVFKYKDSLYFQPLTSTMSLTQFPTAIDLQGIDRISIQELEEYGTSNVFSWLLCNGSQPYWNAEMMKPFLEFIDFLAECLISKLKPMN
jgi:hypothetical protein